PLDLFNLKGKVALVTGGSKGLGKAMARGLVEAGADVVISSRHEDELRMALEEILRGTDRKGATVVADMVKRDDVVRLAQTALERMGRVDISSTMRARTSRRSPRKSATMTGTAYWKSI